MRPSILLFVFLSLFCSMHAQQAPDQIWINGNVYAGKPPVTGDSVVRAQAFAVRDGRVTVLGTSDEIRKLAGLQTQVTDLKGAFVMPGFNDAHAHLWAGGLGKQHVDLTGTRSLEEMKERIAAVTKQRPDGAWIVGRGWDHTFW